MFIVIDPEKHNNYKKLIKPFLDHIKNNPRLKWSFHDHKKAIFILSADKSKSIYGGAILLKQKVASLHKEFQKNISHLGLKNDEVWTCAIFLRKEENCFSKHFEFFFETFYRNLYKKLMEFGMKNNVGFLYMILESGEYLCTEALGCWPYVSQVKSHESMNGLFHGVLSLIVNSSKTHVKTKGLMFSEETRLAA